MGGRWCDLKGIGMVESERHSRDGVSIERRYFITSVDDIELFHQAVRSHSRPSKLPLHGVVPGHLTFR